MQQSKWNDVKKLIQGLFYLPEWHLQRLHKRDKNLWIFDAWSGNRYSDNPRALYEYILAHRKDIRAVWITNNDAVYRRLKEEGKPVTLRSCKEGKAIQKDAGVFFCTHGRLNGESEGDLQYMNGIRYINLWHGAPLKQIGKDERRLVVKTTMWKRIKTWIRRCLVPWEFIHGEMINSSPFFAPYFASAFGKDYKMIDAAEPRLDKLVSSGSECLIDEINRRFNHPTKILYMPTFRDSQFGAFNPFAEAGFDRERIENLLEEQNSVLLYKSHFLDSQNGVVQISKRIIVIGDNDYDDLYTFIKDVDILITDYSSVYFDFLCLRKPIILFPYDYDEYVQHSRPFYFDYQLMEAKKVYSWQEMEDCLKNKTYYPPSDAEIQRFRPLPIGNCCEELFNKIIANND